MHQRRPCYIARRGAIVPYTRTRSGQPVCGPGEKGESRMLEACRESRRLALAGALAVAILLTGCVEPAASIEDDAAPADPAPPAAVSALGRLEPKHGIITVSAPSEPEAISGTILAELLVEVGDDVERGQLLAVSDTAVLHEAEIAQTEAELALARQEAQAAASVADATCVRAGVAGREAARLARHRIELRRSHIHAPMDGRVLAVNARPGELVGMVVGMQGILELGQVDRMYAIAEVYETDVARLRPGQRATVTSAALPRPLGGRIERIRPKVQKQDETHTDPAARKDARIVEVEVALEESAPAAGLTHLQVEVIFQP